ncbi:MAG: isocitrate lyase/phosphoenolpyruvate mutase family protein [Roseitalea sp.]|jgi:2-methylisocitrate lyase-like PEP mutase family enzyme|nr:isocitrate lyase/phosphoenolpyruvate mutase family protein [Roseitalea sp.]MBO6723932.1 isocitrate lyase/phosphoenolpyruvate mutase family protein [Roseitalea sp.]MBO6741815.1 isocitrate lyase/phosphoenolpyruvate mutase family protein [Roseitalea sp.]
MTTLAERHAAFEALHASGCFVIPNPWDMGTARLMAACGAKALATTSAGHAFTLGRPDMGRVTRDEALAHAQDLITATPLPVAGDFENGFADDPDEVAETVRLAAEAGLSGCSVEDTQMVGGNPPYPFALAVERVRAASAAARALGRPFVFCARADGIMNGHYDTDEAIRRLRAFDEAGADLLYAPLPPDMAALQRIVASVTKPFNALAAGPYTKVSMQQFADAGVRRISIGSAMARATHKVIIDATRAMLDHGDFSPLANSVSGDVVDDLLMQGVDRTQ